MNGLGSGIIGSQAKFLDVCGPMRHETKLRELTFWLAVIKVDKWCWVSWVGFWAPSGVWEIAAEVLVNPVSVLRFDGFEVAAHGILKKINQFFS
jgi:hypothetical protein